MSTIKLTNIEEIYMMTIEEIRSELSDRHIRKVAAAVGLSDGAVYRIAKPGNKPSYDTLKALSDYFERKPGASKE